MRIVVVRSSRPGCETQGALEAFDEDVEVNIFFGPRQLGVLVTRKNRLKELGFIKVSGQKSKKGTLGPPPYPAKGKIMQPSHHLAYPHFYGECTVYGRKVDLFIALSTGRMIALEAKDSSSGLNSKKRLLNDTAAKAIHYATQAGRMLSASHCCPVFSSSRICRPRRGLGFISFGCTTSTSLLNGSNLRRKDVRMRRAIGLS